MNLFTLAVGASDRASSRFRVWDHIDWIRRQGNDVRSDSLTPIGGMGGWRLLLRIAARWPRWARDFLWADAILIQETMAIWPLLFVKNVGKRRRVIFDFSDPIDRIGTGMKRQLRQITFDLFVKCADVVVVENRNYSNLLASRARQTSHFYGPVDASRYAVVRQALPIRSADSPFRIGWTGSPGTFHFIAPLMPAIDALGAERPTELVLVGAGPIANPLRHTQLTLVEWNEAEEFATIPTFDLGLFRLAGGDDALWRGAGKLFVYMAAGVPFIANDIGIAHKLMAEAGVGFAVDGDDRWLEELRRAANDRNARIGMTERSIAFAQTALSYEVYRRHLMGRLGARTVAGE